MMTGANAQARSVAAALGLVEDDAQTLVVAYKAARQTQQAAAAQLRQKAMSGGDIRSAIRAVPEKTAALNAAERAKLEEALKGILADEQRPEAMAALGSFNRTWDRMALTLQEYGMEEAPLNEALEQIRAYIVDVAKAEESQGGEDRKAALLKARADLDAAMAPLLGQELMAQWDRSTGLRAAQDAFNG